MQSSTNGVFIAPDIFQEQMSDLMDDLEFGRFYLDDLPVIILGAFKERLAEVEEVIKQLQLDGIKCKINKCKFAVPKLE